MDHLGNSNTQVVPKMASKIGGKNAKLKETTSLLAALSFPSSCKCDLKTRLGIGSESKHYVL